VVFSDLTFIFAFLPLCLLIYWLSRSIKLKNCVLLAASLLFYALGEPVYILIMLAAAASAFLFAFLIDRFRGARLSRFFLAVSVAINIGILFTYKYAPLFVATAVRLFHLNISVPQMHLPIGISFYTFQILTYTIDVYRGRARLQPSAINFFLYVTMFPQVLAGPIVRYNDISGQIDNRYISAERFAAGVIRFICGLAKKVLFADYAGGIASRLLGVVPVGAAQNGAEGVQGALAGVAGGTFAGGIGGALASVASALGVSTLAGDAGSTFVGAAGAAGAAGALGVSTLGAWLGLLFFGFQVYFDFSGYSDMAIGLGRMFGFEILENFKYPFSSKSITEFWRRWHISLGMFFRDYVYIPMGGNRRFQIRNIAVVWILTGLWHGANWNFVLWGCYFGILLVAEKYLTKIIRIKLPALLSWAITFFIITISWGIFYFTDLTAVWGVLTAMFSYRPESNFQVLGLIGESLFFMAMCLIASMPWAKRLYLRIVFIGERKNGRLTAVLNSAFSLLYAAILLFVCCAVRVGSSFSPFLYFRF